MKVCNFVDTLLRNFLLRSVFIYLWITMVASYSPFIFLVSLKIMIGKISLLHPLIFFNAKILTAWLWLATEGKITSSVDNMRERRQFILFPQLQFNARNFNDVSYYYDNLTSR